jgi:hypothetical protein
MANDGNLHRSMAAGNSCLPGRRRWHHPANQSGRNLKKATEMCKVNHKERVMNLTPKSRTASFFLTLVLGPIGLLYTSIAGGVVLFLLAIITFPTIFGPIICWLLAICYGDHATVRHNQSLARFEHMMTSR